MDRQELIDSIDATYLKMDFSFSAQERLCKAVHKYEFNNICGHPYFMWLWNFTVDHINNPIMVANFPYGVDDFNNIAETIVTYRDYFNELDIVLHPDHSFQPNDIKVLFYNKPIKIIIEHYIYRYGIHQNFSGKLKSIINQLSKDDYIKTHTGFGSRGVEADDVKRIKDVIGDSVKIKASGGIRTLEQLMELKEAGADRFGIGIDSAINIIKEFDGNQNGLH